MQSVYGRLKANPASRSRWKSDRFKRIFAIMNTTQKPVSALTLQLLTWIASQPRTYADAMEAWSTSCPRMPIWEDAVSEGLIEVNGTGAMRERKITLSARGQALLRHS